MMISNIIPLGSLQLNSRERKQSEGKFGSENGTMLNGDLVTITYIYINRLRKEAMDPLVGSTSPMWLTAAKLPLFKG